MGNYIKLLLSILLILFISEAVFAQSILRRTTRDTKLGLVYNYATSQKVQLWDRDAGKTYEQSQPITFYGLTYEKIFYDEFGWGVTLLAGIQSPKFQVTNGGETADVEIKSNVYHIIMNLNTYTDRNRRTGFILLYAFDAGIYYNQMNIKTESYPYNAAGLGSDFVSPTDPLDINITNYFVTGTFWIKGDIRFTTMGIRIGAGVTSGSIFLNTKFDVPGLTDEGQLGVRTVYDFTPVASLDIYTFY